MASKFTWFPKLTAALERVPEGPRGELCWAIIQYGTNGIEPEFADWALSAVFESLREDIDNSLAARNKNKGGRPPKSSKAETGVSEDAETSETGVSENGNGGFEVSETTETGVSEPENPSLYTNPYQSIPSQAIPVQGSADACAAPEGFEPPTASEVEAATFRPTRTPEEALAEQERRWASEHPGIDPAKVEAPRGTTAGRAEFGLYQDARRLLAARAACERRLS